MNVTRTVIVLILAISSVGDASRRRRRRKGPSVELKSDPDPQILSCWEKTEGDWCAYSSNKNLTVGRCDVDSQKTKTTCVPSDALNLDNHAAVCKDKDGQDCVISDEADEATYNGLCSQMGIVACSVTEEGTDCMTGEVMVPVCNFWQDRPNTTTTPPLTTPPPTSPSPTTPPPTTPPPTTTTTRPNRRRYVSRRRRARRRHILAITTQSFQALKEQNDDLAAKVHAQEVTISDLLARMKKLEESR